MEEVNPFKETMLLGTFHVALPTFDVYSDIALAVKLYSKVSVVDYWWGDHGNDHSDDLDWYHVDFDRHNDDFDCYNVADNCLC